MKKFVPKENSKEISPIRHSNSETLNSFFPNINNNINNNNNINTNSLANLNHLPNNPKKISQKDIESNLQNNPIPKFIIHNMIYNNIINPIIEAAVEISNNVQNKKSNNYSYSKTSKEVDLEVKEILNKINVLLKENSNSEILNLNNIEIPIQIIFNEFFYDVIFKQYKLVNNCFCLILKNKFDLLNYLKICKEIFFCNSGDIILNYIENVFDYRTLCLKNNSTEFLTNNLINEIMKKFPQYEKIINCISLQKKSKMDLQFSINNLDLCFQLNFKVDEPIDIIFNNSNIIYYDNIFKKLFKFFVFNQIFVKIFKVIKNIRTKNISHDPFFLKICKIMNYVYKTFKTVQFFIFHEIIDKNYTNYINLVKSCNDIFIIKKEHNNTIEFLKDILCSHNLIGLLEKLFFDISNFYLKSIVLDYFDFENLKYDNFFNDTLEKIQKDNNVIIEYIKNEYVIGEFYNLKKYI